VKLPLVALVLLAGCGRPAPRPMSPPDLVLPVPTIAARAAAEPDRRTRREVDPGPARSGSVVSDEAMRTAMPQPVPTIGPAEPVTGLDAYLTVGASLEVVHAQATPRGELTMRAVGQATIEWGDGETTTAPVGDPGGPYPAGRIRHVYERRGPVEIRVTVAWRATWSVGGASGALPVLRTRAALTTTVREIQAVITG
jgi:hypothetical protein